jgi:hypothetical protein
VSLQDIEDHMQKFVLLLFLVYLLTLYPMIKRKKGDFLEFLMPLPAFFLLLVPLNKRLILLVSLLR